MARLLRSTPVLVALVTLVPAVPQRAADGPVYDVLYEARLLPSQGLARVTISVGHADGTLRELRFGIEGERYFRFSADGTVRVDAERVSWNPPPGGGELSYSVKVDHLREAAEYDARLTSDWALFRGSDLFPTASSTTAPGAHARARMRLKLPPGWSAFTPFKRAGNGTYRIEQAARRLDRPAGWILVGEEPVHRQATIAGMRLTLVGPPKHRLRTRDMMALLRWTLPYLREASGELPERLLVVSADDPMWRGGLSGPDSLYLHADRPLIQEDGSCPLLHELVHVVSHAQAGPGGDWIVEGLAEYYSLELLRRSGSVSEKDHEATLAAFRRRGRKVGSLGVGEADGAVTARAVGVLADLDAAIRERTQSAFGLDLVLRHLARHPAVVTPASFRALLEELVGHDFAELVPLPPEPEAG